MQIKSSTRDKRSLLMMALYRISFFQNTPHQICIVHPSNYNLTFELYRDIWGQGLSATSVETHSWKLTFAVGILCIRVMLIRKGLHTKQGVQSPIRYGLFIFIQKFDFFKPNNFHILRSVIFVTLMPQTCSFQVVETYDANVLYKRL